MLPEEIAILKEFNANIAWLKKKERTQTWITSHDVKELTGWNNDKMKRARAEGLVKYKRENGTIRYLKESIKILAHDNPQTIR